MGSWCRIEPIWMTSWCPHGHLVTSAVEDQLLILLFAGWARSPLRPPTHNDPISLKVQAFHHLPVCYSKLDGCWRFKLGGQYTVPMEGPRARIHKQNEKTAKKIPFPKLNFSNGIHKHLVKRYLFTTGKKKVACAVWNRAYCAWAVLFSGKLGLAFFLSLKVYRRVSVVTPSFGLVISPFLRMRTKLLERQLGCLWITKTQLLTKRYLFNWKDIFSASTKRQRIRAQGGWRWSGKAFFIG